MLWWVLWKIPGGTVPMLLGRTGPVQWFPRGIREYTRRWAEVRAAGRHWRGRAWDIGSLNGKADRHTLIRLHLIRHHGHHEVWAAFAHHSYLLSVLIHVG